MKKIDVMFAFVAIDKDGDEGIIGVQKVIMGQNVMMPLVGADMDRVNSLISVADAVSKENGYIYKIVRFSGMEDITEKIKPGLKN